MAEEKKSRKPDQVDADTPAAPTELELERKLDLEAKAVDLEYKRLQMEDTKLRLERERATRSRAKTISDRQEADRDAERRSNAALQARCPHRKGGKDLEGLKNGNDADYCVIKHTYPTGVRTVTCQRCGKEWRPGVKGYREAINFPTDNTESSAGVFTFSNVPPPGWEPEAEAEA